MSIKYHLGEVIHSHFDPGIVAGSYVASLCGCYLTVELLHRRETGLKTWKGWRDTLICATALGLCGIWCMHFIGNRAIILGDGETDIQLVYDPGYSVLSVVLPVIGLSIAFATAEVRFRSQLSHSLALIGTGVFAGLSIVGMHYMGNFGIKNYNLDYRARFFWASIVIAIGDCNIVLFLFYNWRDKWINDAKKRFLCAIALAGGVSAMHFTAATKCIYSLRMWSTTAERDSRNVQVIVAGALCGGSVMIAFVVLLFFHLRSKHRQRSAKKVTISCAIFDSDDRILVTTEGVFPSREITDKVISRTLAEDFDRTHPVFQWIFRITHNWSSVSELIPKMRSHLNVVGANGDIWSSSPATAMSFELEAVTDYSLLLRERFCVAAGSLASAMHLPVEKIGVLYDNIVDTGTLIADGPTTCSSYSSRIRISKSLSDLEMGNLADGLGKGQLLFLTRRVDADEVGKLVNAGFRFGSLQQVGRKIAQNMQISNIALDAHIYALKRYNENLLRPEKHGTFLACFAMIPRLHSKGFEIVVKKGDQAQLPDVQILSHGPANWQAEFIEAMHGKTTTECIKYLRSRSEGDPYRSPVEEQFGSLVAAAISELYDTLPSAFLPVARFCGKPSHPQYSNLLSHTSPGVTLYSFVVLADLHVALGGFNSLARIPLSFLRVRHQCYSGSPHFTQLQREIHQEFGPLLALRSPKSSSRLKKLSKSTDESFESVFDVVPPSELTSDDDSDNFSFVSHNTMSKVATLSPKLSTKRSQQSSVAASMQREPFGGILVNSETVVERDQKVEDANDRDMAAGLGVRSQVGIGVAEPEKTFVDELFDFARSLISPKWTP